MKSIVYFLLSICVILYIAVLCIFNICGEATVLAWGTIGTILSGIATYGGLAIVLLYALVNFFGSPLKTVFFVLLVLVVVIFIITAVIPDTIRNLFGIGKAASDGAKAVISWLNF